MSTTADNRFYREKQPPMIDLYRFVDSLGPLSISKDDAAVAIAAIRAEAILTERERCAKAAEWFVNVEQFTAAQVAARIRSGK